VLEKARMLIKLESAMLRLENATMDRVKVLTRLSALAKLHRRRQAAAAAVAAPSDDLSPADTGAKVDVEVVNVGAVGGGGDGWVDK